ncbi:MAG TPA: hypothetical protein VHR88_10495 [Solirubrobacteraceae bacterium]|nr:hypothetical protein [Solirubrobacteraceae bacterium]
MLVAAAVTAAVTVVAAGPAAAAKGGNNDTAKACQHGGWKTLGSAAGGTFANQGDCVNDGAQASLQPVGHANGSRVCGDIGGTFRSKPTFWACSYGGNPDDTADLQTACSDDGGNSFIAQPPSQPDVGWLALCHHV